MKLTEGLKSVGWSIAAIAIMGVLLVLAGSAIYGLAWISDQIFPWVVWVFWITLAIALLVLGPLAVFSRTRMFAAYGLAVCSVVFGISAWIFSMVVAYNLWGLVALVIGLVFAGVGVVPVAFLAALFKGEWVILLMVVVLVALTFGSRLLALYLEQKAQLSPAPEIS